jgi:hypothetical protein
MNRTPRTGGMRAVFAAILAVLVLAACGGGDKAAPQAPPVASSGQVAPPAPASKVSFYAASRFAEQASFGATPALVAELQAKGFERWIDEQFALPPAAGHEAVGSPLPFGWTTPCPATCARCLRQATGEMLTGPRPVALRVMWSLSQFIVAGRSKGQVSGCHPLDEPAVRELLRQLRHPAARDQSQPAHGALSGQRPEPPEECRVPPLRAQRKLRARADAAVQLGVFKLNPDGTPQRDGRGR